MVNQPEATHFGCVIKAHDSCSLLFSITWQAKSVDQQFVEGNMNGKIHVNLFIHLNICLQNFAFL